MPEALMQKAQSLLSMVSQARSRLSSLQRSLTEHGWVCTHPAHSPVLRHVGLCSSAPRQPGAGQPAHPGELGVAGQAGTASASAMGDGCRGQGTLPASTRSLALLRQTSASPIPDH